jgi:hypothetical protein
MFVLFCLDAVLNHSTLYNLAAKSSVVITV